EIVAASRRALGPASGALFDGLGVAQQHVADVAHAGLDAAGEIVAPERRQDGVLNDELGHDIGELRLETTAHLDAHLAVGGRDEQDCAVVLALLPDRPRPPEAVAEVLDWIAL